jgi:hypothetical protein
MNVGTDWQSLILHNNLKGTSYAMETLGHLTEINAKQIVTKLTSSPIIYGGQRIHRNIYHDFEGMFKWDRYGVLFTQLMLGVMTTAQQQGRETYWTLYGSIIDSAAGAMDELMFQNCVLDDHDIGNFVGTGKVEQGIAFRCQSLVLTGQTGSP